MLGDWRSSWLHQSRWIFFPLSVNEAIVSFEVVASVTVVADQIFATGSSSKILIAETIVHYFAIKASVEANAEVTASV